MFTVYLLNLNLYKEGNSKLAHKVLVYMTKEQALRLPEMAYKGAWVLPLTGYMNFST